MESLMIVLLPASLIAVPVLLFLILLELRAINSKNK
jgi:hypothetical protein